MWHVLVVVSVWLEKCQKIWGWESVSIVVSFLPCLLLLGDSIPIPVCPFVFLKMFFLYLFLLFFGGGESMVALL